VSLEALFAVPANLPTIPKVVQQLIQSFSRDDVSVDDIASKLAADPVLSAKTLRLANSAYFHASRSISTVDDALRMLGFVMVRNLVVGCGMTGAFKAVQGMDLPQFWRYSLQHGQCRPLAGPGQRPQRRPGLHRGPDARPGPTDDARGRTRCHEATGQGLQPAGW
jgi:c-di-GMP-related signal transduction protein